MKTRFLIIIFLAVAMTGLITSTVIANEEQTPAPYAGMKNPFKWDDAGVQSSGKKVYEKSCAGCHGAKGDSISAANFSAASFPDVLETNPDHYFWIISEGALSLGMPPFKAALSDEQRWQVETYLWSLSKSFPSTPTPSEPSVPQQAGKLSLLINEQTQSSSLLMLTAYLAESNGKPVSGQTVQFFLKKEFFTTDWIKLGELETDKQGMATLSYAPREEGEIQVMVSGANLQTTATWTIKSAIKTYQAEAGIRLPTLEPDIAGGTKSAIDPTDMTAPSGSIGLTAGRTLSWLLLFVITVLFIWSTYFRVIRQVLGIAGEANQLEIHNVRVVPLIGMAFILVIGGVLAFMILHGPYTHLSLLR